MVAIKVVPGVGIGGEAEDLRVGDDAMPRLHEGFGGRIVDVAFRHGPFDRSTIVETQFLKGRA